MLPQIYKQFFNLCKRDMKKTSKYMILTIFFIELHHDDAFFSCHVRNWALCLFVSIKTVYG